MEIFGKPVNFDEDGKILSFYPEIESIAFNMASFVANQIFVQTSIEVFDPFSILTYSPELIAETVEEEELLRNTPKLALCSLDGKFKILGKFDPEKYSSNLKISSAIAHFANSWRTSNPFIKFEQFYKVIESIYAKGKNEKAEEFDQRVSEYISKFDSNYKPVVLKKLRQIRNRCVHPSSRRHLSPEDLIATRSIRNSLREMERLARLSIDNPPN